MPDYYIQEPYILDENGNPKKEPDVKKWAKWFGRADRHIGYTKIGRVNISTIFLGMVSIDNGFTCDKPVLWETMIFGGKHDQYQERYCTKEEALIGHEKAVELVKDGAVS